MEPRRAADHRAAVGASSEREAMTHERASPTTRRSPESVKQGATPPSHGAVAPCKISVSAIREANRAAEGSSSSDGRDRAGNGGNLSRLARTFNRGIRASSSGDRAFRQSL